MTDTWRVMSSWGRTFRDRHLVSEPSFLDQAGEALSRFVNGGMSVLSYGLGRSYGDSCLNADQGLIVTSRLDRIQAFDEASGRIRVEAGLSLADLLEFAVPRGWFVPVTPGTKYVTVGGAVANDVHGKNHHVAGTFARHVARLALRRSDGEEIVCSPDQEAELFGGTLGGLGLTGLILWVELVLIPIRSAFIEFENIRFDSVDEFFDLSWESRQWDYTVAWVDTIAGGRRLGRGIFSRGRHAADGPLQPHRTDGPLSVPLEAPSFLLGQGFVRAFNLAYYKRPAATAKGRVHYDPFFYPLDRIRNWNRLYGSPGFYQYQCVVPADRARRTIPELLRHVARSGNASFLSVLKDFGEVSSPGLLSFPLPGTTLALDFPNRGARTLRLLDTLDEIVAEAGGRVYPAKDARLTAGVFQRAYPSWRALERLRDPAFSSGFWRRVTGA